MQAVDYGDAGWSSEEEEVHGNQNMGVIRSATLYNQGFMGNGNQVSFLK